MNHREWTARAKRPIDPIEQLNRAREARVVIPPGQANTTRVSPDNPQPPSVSTPEELKNRICFGGQNPPIASI